ncbi:unnamed protein product [Caenorhabditis bovis]|uniref:AAA+ ATPase domain-containing protein n=1 Tax=Caenorhabditis bovis TaxID=2654633 RepID=A0A8S1F7L6_9PELO|nr:unnamed protein product [Caenorhabditis bovis]
MSLTDRIHNATSLMMENQEESLEMFKNLLVELRDSRRTFNELDDVKAVARYVEAIIRSISNNISVKNEICDVMNRSNGSPEPPADPDVWSPPTQLPQPSRNTKKAAGAPGKAARTTSVSSNAGNSNASAAAEKPVVSMLPSNKAGEVFDTSMYDVAIIQAVRSTMTLCEESNGMTLDEVIGMDDVKQVLHEAITLPLMIPDFFKGLRSPWKALCLAGPPGTGKTLIARAIASVAKSTFFSVSPTDLTSKWRGDSEKVVRLLFDLARFYAPSIIFIDEIDTIGGQRGMSGEHEASRRVKSQFLVEMDGTKNKFDDRRVFVLAATNIPWEIDEALRRRFEKRIFVPLPNFENRCKIIRTSLAEMSVDEEVDIEELSRRSEGFSGADVVLLCRAAAYNVLRRFNIGSIANESKVEALKTEPIRMVDFDSALKSVQSSVDPETVTRCKEWCEAFGSK